MQNIFDMNCMTERWQGCNDIISIIFIYFSGRSYLILLCHVLYIQYKSIYIDYENDLDNFRDKIKSINGSTMWVRTKVLAAIKI